MRPMGCRPGCGWTPSLKTMAGCRRTVNRGCAGRVNLVILCVCHSPGELPTSTCPRSSLHALLPLPPIHRGTTPSPPRFRQCCPSAGLLLLLPNPLLGSSGPIWFLYHRSHHVQSRGSHLSVAPPLPSPPVTPVPLRSCLTSSHLGKAGSLCA